MEKHSIPQQTPSTPPPLRNGSIEETTKPQDDPATSKSKLRLNRKTTTKSTKSGSGSSRRKPDSLRRVRILKHLENRGIGYETVDYKHFPYIWAAAKRGVFDIEDATVDEFKGELTQLLTELIERGGGAYIGLARKGKKDIPICLCLIEFNHNRAYPNVFWFPEASPRNKIELSVKFLIDLKLQSLVLIPVEEQEVAHFLHLCKYGLLRKVGTIKKYFSDGKAVLFQSV